MSFNDAHAGTGLPRAIRCETQLRFDRYSAISLIGNGADKGLLRRRPRASPPYFRRFRLFATRGRHVKT